MDTRGRRDYDRCDLLGSGLINDRIKFSIIDISATGIKVKTEEILKENQEVKVSLKIRYNADKLIHLSGRVLRHLPHLNAHEFAIEFMNVDPLTQIELDEIISRSCGKIHDLCEMGECNYHINKSHRK